jgi:hypothetical protein
MGSKAIAAACAAWLLTALPACALLHAGEPVRFLALGDTPYSQRERELLEGLLARELRRGTPFLVHVGDIKGGNAPCTDAALEGIAALFGAQPVPVVFTPGDNDWTDCRRDSAGAYDPNERLAFLRRLFYADPGVLRLARLGARAPDPEFPENVLFVHRDVVFATVHLVGSGNNRRRGDPGALAEHEGRAAANRRHLQRVGGLAQDTGAVAVVLLFHANPGFERRAVSPAYDSFLRALQGLLAGYGGPVLGIHGDTHEYRFDRPLRAADASVAWRRFQRLEVPGAPEVGAVWVEVDPAAPAVPFRVSPVYPDAREALLGR